MFESKNNLITKHEQAEFVITRVFDAPRKVVFKAWTDLEILKHWWGPKGFTWIEGKMNLLPGGMFHYGLLSPEGNEMWGKFVFRDIIQDERLTYVGSFSDKDCNTLRHPASATWPLSVLTILNFTEHEGKTILILHGIPVNANAEEINTFIAGHHGMQQGMKGTLDQLDEYLTNFYRRLN
ncbi:MAG: activator of Hsp90 ATPase 1 family protein [Ignavibacteria bacterium]|nr:activator of Hsp90 ATPase 1 family protein [Ignavibacteria bacterium]